MSQTCKPSVFEVVGSQRPRMADLMYFFWRRWSDLCRSPVGRSQSWSRSTSSSTAGLKHHITLNVWTQGGGGGVTAAATSFDSHLRPWSVSCRTACCSAQTPPCLCRVDWRIKRMFCVNTLCDDTKQRRDNRAASGAHPLSLSNSVRSMANHWFLYTDVSQSVDDEESESDTAGWQQ